MLEYFYTCESTESEVPLTTPCVWTCHLADKHLVTPLKDLCTQEFARELDGRWCSPEFAAAVAAAYAWEDPETNDALRDAVVAMSTENSAELFGNPSLYPEFQVVAQTTPFFAAAVASSVASSGVTAVPSEPDGMMNF